jgi:flagellar hook-associated protein 3 FlgL
MRITQSEISRNFLADLGSLNGDLASLSRQVSSGKRLTDHKDSPAGSAELVFVAKSEGEIDQYRFNSDAGTLYLGVADSTLNEVNNLFTSVYAKGSQAASESINDDARAALAQEVRSLREQIVSLANSQVNGRYLFAGSAGSSAPFSLEGDAVVYNGDDAASSIRVDAGLDVPMSFAGSEVFNSVFGVIDALLAGIGSNDVAAIKESLEEFSSALSGLSQVRGRIGAHMGTLESVKARLDTRETSLKEQRSRIEDADMAQAVVQLNQTQTALDAAMSAGASVLQQSNLFDILG